MVSLQSRDVEDSAALTLMGTDVERIVESLRFFHETWAAIPEVATGVWLLSRQVLYASIAPIVICVVCTDLTSAIIIGNVPRLLAPFLTLAIYALIALTSGDQSLLVTQAFTSLALINLVTEPLLMFCQALLSLTQAVSCYSRIKKMINSPSWHLESRSPLEEDTSAMSLGFRARHSSSPQLVTFRSANISWFPKNHQGRVVLRNLNFSIPTGFTAIVGPPWLTNDTIKSNIIGELEFDQTWFSYVIRCCTRREELENLPGGIMTVVGENGSSLSGGQRQRVALARAVYSKLPTVILDDFISGLDPKAAKTVQTSLCHANGHFRKAGISVVLAANGSNLFPYMDNVVLLHKGSISDTGSYKRIKARNPDMFKLDDHKPDFNYDRVKEEGSAGPRVESQGSNSTAPEQRGQISSSNGAGFSRQKGSWSVYSYYGEKVGKLFLFSWAISTLIGAISDSSSSNPIPAPFYFFLESDLESITNRFSQDMNLIDMTLPSQALQFTSDTISGIATIRTFSWQMPFSGRLAGILNRSQRPFYMLFCAQQWLTLVVDLVAVALAVTFVAIALSLTANGLGPGALGVALVMTLQFNGLPIQTIQSWTKPETSIGVVARVQQFVKEAPSDLGRFPAPSNSWPQNGRVQVQRLTAAHTPRSEDVLKDVNLDIAAGEKIAVCGSSGIGTSWRQARKEAFIKDSSHPNGLMESSSSFV
ncbi:uncharacterized protein Triagg1_7677 [Trichoderma aggressivum f. europaeum]|uniref:ABC transporter domain-containing protein n=1 Tax=Trichoderma aggressivum f. europaeum TaxID=173218 RepID=A0AAE1I980_9HYPO|nr:hypothetical protein Triagg1_7677 [Trichoderma aggressivum f. europaeum]